MSAPAYIVTEKSNYFDNGIYLAHTDRIGYLEKQVIAFKDKKIAMKYYHALRRQLKKLYEFKEDYSTSLHFEIGK